MILSRCCRDTVTVFETLDGGYYACEKCKLPTETYMAIISAMDDNKPVTVQNIQGEKKMDILDLVKKHVGKSLAIPVIISAANFAGLFFASISDGDIDDVELHNLISTGSGIELIVLVLAMAILKLTSKK